MKLTVAYAEAQDLIGDKFNMISEDVEISPRPDALFVPAPSPAAMTEAVKVLVRQAVPSATGFYDKIGMIKATRTILGIGLKESKDLVESCLPPF